MRLRCKPRTNAPGSGQKKPLPPDWLSAHSKLSRLTLLSSCLSAISFCLPASAVFADNLNLSNGSSLRRVMVADNSAYEGASLPPPVKKKNQVTVSTDDAPDVTAPPRKKHRHTVDVDTDPMAAGDTSGGATLPPPKRGLKSNDMAGAKASAEKDSRPSGAASGPDKRGGRDHEPGSMFGRGPLDLTALNLTDDQKQKIAQMHAENGTKMRDLMRKRRELMNQMKDVMFEVDVTESQIRAKRDEARQVQEKLEDLRLNDFLAIRGVLTPEQKLKLKDVKIANGNGKGRDGDGPPGPLPGKRADAPDSKRLADTPK